MMEKVIVEVEYLIRKIEKMKRTDYECFHENEGLGDPFALAQLTQRLLGEQAAYDNLIHYLRGIQGSDAE